MGFIRDFVDLWKETRQKRQSARAAEIRRRKGDHNIEKDAATAAGEPWVGIIHMEVDPDNLSDGVIELDWNDRFLTRLVKSGYGFKGATDKDIIDNWFQTVCSNVANGTYEQEMADPDKRRIIQKRQLDDGRTEIG